MHFGKKNFIFAAAAVLVAAGVLSLVILQNNKADENIPTFSVEEYTPFIQRFAKEQPVARLKNAAAAKAAAIKLWQQLYPKRDSFKAEDCRVQFNREQQIYLVQYNANSVLNIEKLGALLSVKNKKSIAVWEECLLLNYTHLTEKYSGTQKLGQIKNAEGAVSAVQRFKANIFHSGRVLQPAYDCKNKVWLVYSCPLERFGGKLEILLRESDGLILAERYEK